AMSGLPMRVASLSRRRVVLAPMLRLPVRYLPAGRKTSPPPLAAQSSRAFWRMAVSLAMPSALAPRSLTLNLLAVERVAPVGSAARRVAARRSGRAMGRRRVGSMQGLSRVWIEWINGGDGGILEEMGFTNAGMGVLAHETMREG